MTTPKEQPTPNPSRREGLAERLGLKVLSLGFLSPDNGGTEGGAKTIEDLGWAVVP